MSIKVGDVTFGIIFSTAFLAFILIATGGITIRDAEGTIQIQFHIGCISIPGVNNQIGACDPTSAPAVPHRPPQGSINNVWVEHNVYESSQYGMRIHLQFSVSNLKDISCKAVAYFHYATGESLKDVNGRYMAKGGSIAVGDGFTPPFDNTNYSDFTLFMPYNELDLAWGTFDLKFQVELYDEPTNTHFTSSLYQFFTITNK